jgi:hypothetical protein
MAFKVFLTYSLDPSDEGLAWRLQTLAAAYGIEMSVPRRDQLPVRATALRSTAFREIDRSDCVLAIITGRADQFVEAELKHAQERRKPIVPIVRSDLAGSPLLSQFQPVFIFSPGEYPGKLETEVVEFLKQQQLSKEKTQAIGALVAVGVGLLFLYSLSEK